MELSEITKALAGETEANALVRNIIDSKVEKKTLNKESVKITDFIKQYDPKGHAVLDTVKRKDKQKKAKGGGVEMVPVSRLPVPFQKIIVKRAVSFLLGNKIQIKAPDFESKEQNELLALVKKIWQDGKMDYVNKDIARILFSETEVAELWFAEKTESAYWSGTTMSGIASPKKLRCRVLAESKGDRLHPVFDQYGDMIAFGRYYEVIEQSEGIGASKKVELFDLYTDKTVTRFKAGNGWEILEASKLHGFDKIPVIYYHMEWPVWFDVQEMIERLETRLSNFADTNDYFGDPIVTVKGKIEGFADKSDSGKVLQLENEAEAKYLTWEHAPESTKLEFETLTKFIFSMSQTPDISFEAVKGIGQLSGVALELLFMDAHLRAKDNETFFGAGIQRRLNFICHALSKFNVKLESIANTVYEPVFTPYMPSNVKEMIDMLTNAVGGKAIMSTKTAVMNNPLVQDPEKEMTEINSETVAGME